MPALADAIAHLASTDATVRARAAAELYRAGRVLGDAATQGWRADAELAALLVQELTVGVTVTPEHFQAIRAVMGAPRLADVPPDQDAQEFELHLGEARLDILTTRVPGGSGAIAKFLEKFGEGIQQVEYFVRDVDRATELLRGRFGVQPIYPQTRAGADGTRVNFFLASTPDGKKVLIELVQT
ncbi:MAG: hypothetical protein HY234_13950 [Acidobacteria bacterium]|nr:hypothetical protein [Acidobacteriota bacterium]